MGVVQRFSLTGKVVVVTGGGRGIGEGIAIGMAEQGADVAIVDLVDGPRVAATCQRIEQMGRRAWFFQQDLAATQELEQLAAEIWQSAGCVDVLVNNAGIGHLEHFNQISYARWRQVMAVNADAVFFLSQQIAERMIAAGISGRIINTSSVNGLVAEAGLAHYNASKGAVEMITKSLAIELGAHGITVNSVCPGMIDTEIDDAFPLDEGFQQYFDGHIPLGHRVGKVDECVGAYLFLASDAGRYVTGQHIVVDGGLLCEQAPRLQFMPPYSNTHRPIN